MTTESKTCLECGLLKQIDCFHKNKKMHDGHLNYCKVCLNKKASEFRSTLEGKLYSREKKKLFNSRNPDKKKEYNSAYKKLHRERYLSAKRSEYLRYKEKYAARRALNKAIESGRIIRPSVCSVCFVECLAEGHHWSYSEDHWFDVKWVCSSCHHDIHNPAPVQKDEDYK